MDFYDDTFGGISEALDIVDKAISTGNFDNMSDRIKNAVETPAGNYRQKNKEQNEQKTAAESHSGGYTENVNTKKEIKEEKSGKPERTIDEPEVKDPLTAETPYFKEVPGVGTKRALFRIGVTVGALNVLLSVLTMAQTVINVLSGNGDLVKGVSMSLFYMSTTVVYATIARYGKKGEEAAEHYKQYRKILSVNGYANIADMAKLTDIPEDKVRKELRSMTKAGMFKQGHFDDNETCFIASDEMYQLYRRAEDNSKKLREEAERERREQGYLPSEIREVLEKGKEYVALIRGVNDEIPGKEVSDKLDIMETLVSRIFEALKENPAQADKLSTFMDYYLPTTAKLITAYRDMDKKEIQSESIVSAKREIESTLDMINAAFESLFDSMFREKSLDIQTDIDVMKTMMKQQGLTPSELDIMRRAEQGSARGTYNGQRDYLEEMRFGNMNGKTKEIEAVRAAEADMLSGKTGMSGTATKYFKIVNE